MERKIFGKIIFKVIKLSLIGIGIIAIIFGVFVYYFASLERIKPYGNCAIEYYSRDFTETEIDKVADVLSKEEVFGTSKSVKILLEKNNSNYKIIVPVISSDVNQETYQAFRNKLQSYFPKNKIVFALCMKDDYDNIVRTFE